MVSMGDMNVRVRGQFMGFVISFHLSLGPGNGIQITRTVTVIWIERHVPLKPAAPLTGCLHGFDTDFNFQH